MPSDERSGVAGPFRELLDLAPDAMVVSDGAGRILAANGHAELLLGYSKGELVGQAVEVLLPERFRSRHVEHRAAHLADARPRPMGARLALVARRKDGREVPVEISLSPVERAGAAFVITGMRDISERMQAQAEHERAVRSREELLALLSHDLQNTVNALALNTELLLRVTPESEREARLRGYGQRVARSADTMKRLIRDLLDVQQMELGRFSIDSRMEEVVPLVEEAIEPLEAVARDKEVRLETRLDRDSGVALCDRGRIQQVLQNLVGNAIKFVPEGGRVVVETGPADAKVRFAVGDNGPGIRPEDLPHVFDRHWQAPSNTLRRGSGLGLFIVKTIVEAHHGRAWVESTPGAGASFYFTLPAPGA